jgi:hypothetical protein
MLMKVTDEVLATLRAGLSARKDEYLSRWDQLEGGARHEFRALLSATFCEAVDRRFAPAAPAAEVIEYVGDVRSRTAGAAAQIDPRSAERLILAVYAGEDIGDIPPGTVFRTQILLLSALVADAGLDDAGLDELLGAGRATADSWLAAPAP